MPVTQALVAKWTARGAVEFEVFAILPLLFTAGVVIAHKLGDKGGEKPGIGLIKQPIIIMALLGLLLNLAKGKMPGIVAIWVHMATVGIVPLAMIAVGLALQWHQQWNELWSYVVPVAVIQLIRPAVHAAVRESCGDTATQIVYRVSVNQPIADERRPLGGTLHTTAVTHRATVSV